MISWHVLPIMVKIIQFRDLVNQGKMMTLESLHSSPDWLFFLEDEHFKKCTICQNPSLSFVSWR